MQSLDGKHTLNRMHSSSTGPPQVRPVASPSPQLGPVRPTSPTQSRSGSVTPPLVLERFETASSRFSNGCDRYSFSHCFISARNQHFYTATGVIDHEW